MVDSNNKRPADIIEAINTFKLECRAIGDNFTSMVNALATPSSLYHYTDSAGLLGILKSGKVRLTNIFGLNDPSELKYGLKYASEFLKEETQGGQSEGIVFALIFQKAMVENVEKLGRFLVACFSRDKDDLGQWRTYGDNGGGFAIGFDGVLLEDAFVKEDARYHSYDNSTFHVFYNDSKRHELHQHLIKEALLVIAKLNGRNLEVGVVKSIMVELSTMLSISVIFIAMAFKHEAYKDEKEYRFQQFRGIEKPVDDLEHHARNYSLVEFTDFEWKTEGSNVLREIIIGPASQEGTARKFVEASLVASGFDPDKLLIRQSKIPYRNK